MVQLDPGTGADDLSGSIDIADARELDDDLVLAFGNDDGFGRHAAGSVQKNRDDLRASLGQGDLALLIFEELDLIGQAGSSLDIQTVYGLELGESHGGQSAHGNHEKKEIIATSLQN